MRLLLTNILFLLTINLYGQSDLGIGLVSIKFDDKTVLNFYESQIDTTPTKTIEFFDDKSIKSWNIRNLDEQEKWLKPEVLWLDYSSFVFICRTQANNWFEVIVNNETGKSFWLKKSDTTKFSSWETYLVGTFNVSRLANHSQKIRKQPNNNSEEIKYFGQDCFQVKSMNGDWIEIFTADYCEESNTETRIKSGWIKWRQGNDLLIVYSLSD